MLPMQGTNWAVECMCTLQFWGDLVLQERLSGPVQGTARESPVPEKLYLALFYKQMLPLKGPQV